ncbi:SPOR domain-containing protein [Stagnihabitans tardus]|uniref:SPOR domain-containing protein n=1 Tax=Stagnihabitans tardus TaxID=2699202 RepID=A0AAE4YCA7_9RHOB|nr:SPOR domain-containing protein [Stagnihabitans tardus]NBZ87614.1 hypothetical protein [Stagnihabitans tardus]
MYRLREVRHMADYDFDQFEGYDQPQSAGLGALGDKARRWVHIAGAVSSVALILGLGVWGYQLAVRDVTGVPVMRAMAGAMRISPADPGGQQALNQGLTVNAVAAMGSPVPQAEEITLAPAAADLMPEDAAPVLAEEVPAVQPRLMLADPENASSLEMALIDPAAPTPDQDFMKPDGSVLDNPNVIRVSLRPAARPQALGGGMQLKAVQTVSGESEPSPVPADFQTIEAAAIPTGTPLVQFGVFETPEAARDRYGVLLASFPEVMGDLTPMIEAAQSGGRNFYRLRAEGYASLDEAREFCKGLPSNVTDCIPVVKK